MLWKGLKKFKFVLFVNFECSRKVVNFKESKNKYLSVSCMIKFIGHSM